MAARLCLHARSDATHTSEEFWLFDGFVLFFVFPSCLSTHCATRSTVAATARERCNNVRAHVSVAFVVSQLP